MNKVKAVLALCQAYCLRIGRCIDLINATLKSLQNEADEMELILSDELDVAVRSLGEVEEAIKAIKKELHK